MKTEPLTTSESLMLDVIRVTAAVLVAYGHFSQNYFGNDWTGSTVTARKAVSVFFILSGFVIRYVTCRRAGTLPHYMVDRASRMYSVVAPALLITLLADTIGRHYNAAFYAPWDASSDHPLWRIVANLLFVGQRWTTIITPLSNTPFWSVSYEVAYYLMYGCFFYLAGYRRWVSLGAIALFFGPRVLYLAPLWIGGCLLHDLYQRWSAEGKAVPRLTVFTLLCSVAYYGLMRVSNAQSAFFQTPLATRWFTFVNSLGIRPQEYIFGIAWMAIFLWLIFLARQITLRAKTTLVRVTHFIAEGTFPIYLLHFPLFALAAACLHYRHNAMAPNVAIFLAVLALGIFAGHPANLLKLNMRNLLLRTR